MTKDRWRIFRWSRSPKGTDKEESEEVWTMKEARVLFCINKRTLAFHSLNIPWTPRSSSCLLTNFLRPLSIAYSIDNIDKKPLLNLVPLEKSSIRLGLEKDIKVSRNNMTMMGINKTRETKTSTTRVNNFINLRSTNRSSQCPIAEKLLTRSFDIFPSN